MNGSITRVSEDRKLVFSCARQAAFEIYFSADNTAERKSLAIHIQGYLACKCQIAKMVSKLFEQYISCQNYYINVMLKILIKIETTHM